MLKHLLPLNDRRDEGDGEPRCCAKLIAVLGGTMMPLAYAPFELYPLATLGLVLLFWLWSHDSPRRAFWHGGLFGVGMFGTGVSWVFVSIHEFGHVSWILSVFLTFLFVVVLSLFPAVAGWVAALLHHPRHAGARRSGMVLIYPAVWTLFEWIRGWFLTGFPWLNVGYSQIDAPLSGLAPVAGIYGVSLAASLSSALLLAAFAGGDGRIRGGFLTGIVGLWFVTALAGHIVWTHPTGAPLKASLIQGNIPQDIKWLPAMRQPTFDLYARLTREHLDSDLIIWPETALPSFYRHARSFLSALGDEARASNTEVLIGLVYQTPGTQRYYNSMVTIGNDEAMYYKHHLVPFTEYLPLKKVLVGLVDFLDVPMSDFSAGNIDQPPLKMAGQKVAVTICYEDVFGEEVIRALPEASLLVNVSNDAWFGESIAPQQHLQIARMRALESGRPLLRATNTGMTALVDARGDIQSQAPQFSEHVLSGYVQPMGGATPYIRMGNLPVLALIGLMSGAGTFLSRGSAANDHRHA